MTLLSLGGQNEPATQLEFGLLGRIMVRQNGAPMPVPQGKQRAVLAALLLNAGNVVSLDQLTEVLWGHSPPPSARVAVQNHIMRLRKALADTAASRIRTQPRGYEIDVGTAELDLSLFQAHLDAARAAARDSAWEAAAAQARAGLSLWRGEPLEDVESEFLALWEAPRLTDLRLQAREACIEADLHLGRHTEVITELRQLTRDHPLRERLHGLLMLALYRDGRQAEALAAYQDARHVIIDELGTEPGTGLYGLHQQVLTADPALAPPDQAPAEPAPIPAGQATPVPRQLPAPAADFTGRTQELQALTTLQARRGSEASAAVPTVVIGGTAGVGKTALAVHWAHQAAAHFPDGQLYVNLRGYDPGPPMPATDGLAGFLRALGVAGQDVPAEEGERAALYRSLLAGRRMLVLLDNAASAEQVRPLLPGSPTCVVVVTSRDGLSGLVARDGAARLAVDLLPLEDAVGLLRALIGERVDADPVAAATLAEHCSRLPLALRVAAEFAASRPAAQLADIGNELADQQKRLDLLEAGGDRATAVRAVFSWSCRHLDTEAGRMFRLLGLHPGPDFEPYAAAALAGTMAERARERLDVLARAHLIQATSPGRYGLHDLLRDYARELAAAQDGPDEERAALTRLFDHYLHTAAAAMDALYPAEAHRRPRIPAPATQAPPVADPAAARSWLDAQRVTLVGMAVHAAEHGWPGHATRLAKTLSRYLEFGGHYPEAITIHAIAHTAARQAGDRAAEAAALNALGVIDWHQGRPQQATVRYGQALELFERTGDRSSRARSLSNIGIIHGDQGRYQQAIEYYERALSAFREIRDRLGEGLTLGNLGVVEERQGRYTEAAHHLRQSLGIARDTGHQQSECTALIILGVTALQQGSHDEAADHLYQSLTLCRQTGYRNHEAGALTRIGDLCLRQGDVNKAVGHLRAALDLYREIGDRSGEADALNSLGDALRATGHPGDSHTQHAAALRLASQTGDQHQEARAHDGLGHVCYAAGEADRARAHWRDSLALYTHLGEPEADLVRARLAASPTSAGQP